MKTRLSSGRSKIANQAPIIGGHSRSTVRPVGRDYVEYEAEMIVVGGDYFETLGIPIVRGRRGFWISCRSMN